MDSPLSVRGTAIPPIVLNIRTPPCQTPPNLPPASQHSSGRPRRSGIRARSFLAAVCNGNVEEVERDLSARRMKLCHPLTGCSTIHLAVLSNSPAVLEILLRNLYIDINMKDNTTKASLLTKSARIRLSSILIAYELRISMIVDGRLDLCHAPPMPQHEEMFARLAQIQVTHKYSASGTRSTQRTREL
ncbi:unnamed protein product [Nippostrongylus brasiliensis]|uniref:ANK_REP_REGION domain-containing protein n=1 Tax=Nippostrongylus brasiliensis TaxID=27835 RepID=A0A0N4Y9A9_NIPBR|nr:unnamed protein product [Nippostrongylus brasiliensis]